MIPRYLIGLIVIVFGIISFKYTYIPVQAGEFKGEKENQAEESPEQIFDPLQITIVLKRMYLDGEISEEKYQETIWSMEDFWAKYDQWELVDMGESSAVFRQKVDDISPLLKANGYFGITDEGVLSIFNGKPGSSQIIQSFFQIDVQKLESRKREELLKGIPIMTKDRYEQVLETFKGYSMQPKQKN